MSKPQPIPVYLIIGLLGSGKTTLLLNLINQKPVNENWGILINEFGEIDIDNLLIAEKSKDSKNIQLQAVSGGCICCSATLGLNQAINKLLISHIDGKKENKQGSNQTIDRLFIEPTGLGHPASIIDLIAKTEFITPIKLINSLCVISPNQLTQERWQKSKVMRDLVHLADSVILNKLDQSSKNQIKQAQQILNACYPKKNQIISTEFSQVDFNTVLKPPRNFGLNILSKLAGDSAENTVIKNLKTTQHNFVKSAQHKPFNSNIEEVQEAYASYANESNKNLATIGWVWASHVQFNRVKLKQFFAQYAPYLIRAKGVLKTGNEWQILQFSEDNHSALNLSDIAWRKDSRLQLLFKTQVTIPITIEALEAALLNCIHTR